MMVRSVALVVLATLLTSTNAAVAQSVQYVCNDGTRLTAAFSPAGTSPGNVVLVMDGIDADLTLPQVKSADGGRYVRGDVEFWIKGRDATFTRGDKKLTCQSK